MINEKNNTVENSQNSFSGGMNLIEDDTAIRDTEYRQAFNLINRFGKLEPLLDAKEINPELIGIKQGGYNFGPYIIIFVAGRAYYKHFTQSNFTRIATFLMSETVTRMYAEFVPASYLNLTRKLSIADSITSDITIFNVQVAPTPAAMVVNDGVNQPQVIFYDGSTNTILSRETKKYSEWNDTPSMNAREYVPIGRDMIYVDGILFMVSKDKKRLYRSVTGRPLDFVVNVNNDGNKVSGTADDELYGGADSSDYAVGYDDIVGLNKLTDETFIVSTNTPQSYIIKINRERLVWGEPTFTRAGSFTGSALNSFAVADVLGETALITSEGVLSFNASRQNLVENKNAIFSLNISSAFKDVVQVSDECCVGTFNDFVLFSVNSTYGPIIALYDKLRECWASFYNSTNGIRIKQFISLTPNARELYGISWDNKIFKFFSSTNYITSNLVTKAFNSENPSVEQKLNTLNLIFTSPANESIINVTPRVDENTATVLSKKTNTKPLCNIPFEFNFRPLNGFKISYNISWTGGRSLTQLFHVGNILHPMQSPNEAKQFTSLR